MTHTTHSRRILGLATLLTIGFATSLAAADGPKEATKPPAPPATALQIANLPAGVGIVSPRSKFIAPSQAILIGLRGGTPLSQPEKKKIVAVSGSVNDTDFETPFTLTPRQPSAAIASLSFYRVAYVNNTSNLLNGGVAVMGTHGDASVEISMTALAGRRYLIDCFGSMGSQLNGFNLSFTTMANGTLRPAATIPVVNGHATFVLTGATGDAYVLVANPGKDWAFKNCEITPIH